jgi:hypothetical protein
MELPQELQSYRHGLDTALRTPDLGAWPEGAKFHEADQARELAAVLIPAFHTELTRARIAFLFKENHTKLGEAKRAGAQLVFLAHRDFIITFDWTRWHGLQMLQKVALVDHELEHCTTDEDGNWECRDHQVEEFGNIVRRYGLWHGGLRSFAKAVQYALEQPDLFTQREPVAEPEGFRMGTVAMAGQDSHEELAEAAAAGLKEAGFREGAP